MLTSYLPTFKDSTKIETALERTCQPVDYCIDSGAHVWLAAFFKKAEKKPIAEAEAALERFTRSVKALPRKPTFVVELDLQRIYGMDTVEAWRRDLWKPFEKETGIRVAYVWHQVDGEPKWYSMLNDPDMRYLGIGGDRSISVPLRTRFLLDAYHAAKPVHGFASVDTKWMKQIPFYSVDSTSWAVGAQVFGLAPTFNPMTGKIRQHHAGKREFLKNPKAAAAGLLKAKNIFASDISGKEKNLGRFFTAAGDVFRQLEEWHTAWWKAKGLDWDAQLKKHDNLPPGDKGGHLKRKGA